VAQVSVRAIPSALGRAFFQLRDIALALGAVQAAHGLDVAPEDWAHARLNHGLLLPAYAWACGAPFAAVCTLTDVDEGVIVRAITRMDECCREARGAARILGNPALYRTMEAASAAIKRDVIFANSLYLD